MYFVCPSCRTVLRIDPGRVPARRARYTCRTCATASVVQDHLTDTPPPPGGKPTTAPLEPDLDGTVYHHINDLGRCGEDAITYELVCGVKPLDGRVTRCTFTEGRFTAGRGEADLKLDDPLVSRVHLEIERVGEKLLLKDLGSTNGTFLNDRRVTAEFFTEVDVVRLGNTRLKVKLVAK